MRVTKKTDTKEGTTISMPKAIKAYWKLKKYEDIEEWFEINLPILFEALENGIYAIKQSNIMHINAKDLVIWRGQLYWKEFGDKVLKAMFDFKDYGKTWALTKEELL